MFRGKVAVIGAGAVGSTTAYTIMCGGLFNDIVLIDINKDKAEGDALDMAHGVSFVKPVNVSCGDYSDCTDADIVIITAGAPQNPGETRLSLVQRNVKILKSIVSSLMKYVPDDVILLVVSNPVDILTYITQKLSGLPKNQVIGSGTVLDTSRLKYILSRRLNIDARNCHTYIIGEHGDSEVPTWSLTNIAGIPITAFDGMNESAFEEMRHEVVRAAYDIIEKNGATFYAIALAVSRICACVAGEENSILTVSAVLDGEYGIYGTALSVPVKLSGTGIDRIPEIEFAYDELDGLYNSADTMKKIIAGM